MFVEYENGRPSIIECSLVGTCLRIRLLETAQYIAECLGDSTKWLTGKDVEGSGRDII
jgi:hypothetical protein